MVGDKVLFSESSRESVGDVYYLGRTVDLATDKHQTGKWTTAPDPRLEFLASATASFDGTELKLHIEQIQRVRDGSAPSGRFTQTTIIRILGCRACTVLAVNMTVRHPKLNQDYYMKHSSSCQVSAR